MKIHFRETENEPKNGSFLHDEGGIALIFVLLALSFFCLMGLFLSFKATMGLRISDNYESRVQATYAALAGLNHARALMRGLDNDAFLKGPDGVYGQGASYLESAKSFHFRNPLPLVMAHTLNMLDPASDLPAIPDDGIINTGFYLGTHGIPLIPITGIARKTPKPDGSGEIITSRYFVKVTDNNGDLSETVADSEDNPFIDSDGTVIIRSMGIAKTFSDRTGSVLRRNSVVVVEGRYRKFTGFDFGPALLVLGSTVLSSFEGNYDIAGGPFPGIGTIDTDLSDVALPGEIMADGPLGNGDISGAGLPNPAIRDITDLAVSDPERSSILDPLYLEDFVFNTAVQHSDNYYGGDQYWDGGNTPDIGVYDFLMPFNAPEQNPKITVVHGDLHMSGDASGGGLLVVTGDFECVEACRYAGLVLVIGSGRILVDTAGTGITGGLVAANFAYMNEVPGFGIPDISIKGSSRIIADEAAVKMALGLLPPVQTGFREITGIDPSGE